jgi:hypothetical protein
MVKVYSMSLLITEMIRHRETRCLQQAFSSNGLGSWAEMPRSVHQGSMDHSEILLHNPRQAGECNEKKSWSRLTVVLGQWLRCEQKIEQEFCRSLVCRMEDAST